MLWLKCYISSVFFFFNIVIFFVKSKFVTNNNLLFQALVKLGFSLDSPAFYTVCEVIYTLILLDKVEGLNLFYIHLSVDIFLFMIDW